MSYGEYTERTEINCPRDCGGAVEVEVEVSWDYSVNYFSVAWIDGPTASDCECGELTETEKTKVREEAEENVRESGGIYS